MPIATVMTMYNIMILSKYAIPSLTVSVSDIKNLMWRHFVDVSYDKL